MQKKSHYEIYRDKKGGYRFRLIAPNGEIVATSESYKTRTAVMNSVKKMTAWANTEHIQEEKPKRSKKQTSRDQGI